MTPSSKVSLTAYQTDVLKRVARGVKHLPSRTILALERKGLVQADIWAGVHTLTPDGRSQLGLTNGEETLT